MDKISGNDIGIIVGDFNINWNEISTKRQKIEEIINDNFFNQIVNQPTRVTSTTSTLIDYVVINIDLCTAKTCTNLKISDHESIEVKFPSKRETVTTTKNIQILRYNDDLFRRTIVNDDIYYYHPVNSVDDYAERPFESINRALHPMICTKETKSKKLPNYWFNSNLKRMQVHKQQLHQRAVWINDNTSWENYRHFRNQYKSQLRSAKETFISNKIDNCTDQRSMWKTIKEFVLKKDDTHIKKIKVNGSLISDEKRIAEEMNKFFIESVEEIVSIKILLNNFDLLGEAIKRLINESMRWGIFPKCLKESYVIPIPKIKNTDNPNEIRPVNMLPILSKILKKVIYTQLNSYFESNNVFIETQSGLRHNHNCESLLNLVITQWKSEVTNKNCIIAVFLDLKRAFETVDRELLVQKIEKYGVKGVESKWFKSYLEERTQRTKCGLYVSSGSTVGIGVPQGAILGTLLFLIYINDLKNILRNTKLCLFADDALLYITGKNTNECISKLNEDLRAVEKYLKMNKLKLNINKTNVMIINGVIEGNILIDEQEVNQVEEIKYLVAGASVAVLWQTTLSLLSNIYSYIVALSSTRQTESQRNRRKISRRRTVTYLCTYE
ncbi:uncharacterized protein LOC142231427 [Haematobia irritans]|uniref:uncharacterized protein LOC142231427 n=1 Tax=Haematobia irritans TaxID=7368 RepID=UPI003F502867